MRLIEKASYSSLRTGQEEGFSRSNIRAENDKHGWVSFCRNTSTRSRMHARGVSKYKLYSHNSQ